MKKRVQRTKYIWLTVLCISVSSGCASNPDVSVGLSGDGVEETAQTVQEETQEREEGQTAQETQSVGADFFEQQMQENADWFYEEAKAQGIEREEAAKYVQVLTEDNLFQDGAMALTGLRLDDIDGNGQMDMLVMVVDAQEKPFYGSGALWFYMNDDEPYCFSEESCSYYGWFDVFWDDIDNDENVEIVFSAQGTGCGAVGDSYKAVFKYRRPPADGEDKDSGTDGVEDSGRIRTTDDERSSRTSGGGHEEERNQENYVRENYIERMQLPSDFTVDYDFGIGVEVYQEPEAGQYTAYCPYFDEKISFSALNIEGWSPPEAAESVGGEVRGFYNLRTAQYEGKKVLQASEYLSGEGGTVHNVATAQFLITWEEDGTPRVIKWWIEEDKNTYADVTQDLNRNGRAEEVRLTDLDEGLGKRLEIWEDDALLVRTDGNFAHAGQTSVFLCTLDGEDYLLRYHPTM